MKIAKDIALSNVKRIEPVCRFVGLEFLASSAADRSLLKRLATPQGLLCAASLAVVVLSLVWPMPVLAQGKPGENKGGSAPAARRSQVIGPLIDFARRWDLNHDNIYACDELKSFMMQVFSGADFDRNKTIDEKEFVAVQVSDAIFSDASLSYFDANNDGKVSQQELVEHKDRSSFFTMPMRIVR